MPDKLHRCVDKVKEQGKSEDSAWAICTESVMKGNANPCWEGYEMIGMKEKDGREVPNCVKKSTQDKSESMSTVPEEEITIKSVNGDTYLYKNNALYKLNTKNDRNIGALVVKSMRTKMGAIDWIKTFGNSKKHKVVTSKELVTYKSYSGNPETNMYYHVVEEK